MSSPPLTFDDLEGIEVGELRGVGDRRREALHQIGIHTVLDLLMTYPRRWVDRTRQLPITDLEPDREALVLVEVVSMHRRQTRRGGGYLVAVVTDGTARIDVIFFNQAWRERQLPPGTRVAIFGRPTRYRGSLQFTNPLVDPIGDRTGRVVAVYPQSEKARVTSWDFSRWIDEVLRRASARGLADPVPEPIRRRYGLVERGEAFRTIHQPDSMSDVEAARRRLAFDELLRVQLSLVARKKLLEREQRGVVHMTSGPLLERFLAGLPYPLTGAQQRVIAEIGADLAAPHPMHRLLQGDVGSGKTVVAVATLLMAVQGGHQGALMAPTEVLAEQHAAGVRALLAGLSLADPDNLFGDRPVRVELLTNRVTGQERREILRALADGEIDIAIGTHALIQEGVSFASLGAVVVDEQHRFGVEQRAALRDKGSATVPDLLVMTATPIPRTAAMTVYGDLDVSILDELPPGRTPIATRAAVGDDMVAMVWEQVRNEVADGRQAYVVCPLIDESDKLAAASAEETLQRLSTGELARLRLALLHGRVDAASKQATMDAFRAGAIDVLVATTVIEVGVDVPNATIMVVLGADRFGIAQLHQLRGRVGRGVHASTCWLVPGDVAPSEHDATSNRRIEALVNSTDGFELAEVDLELRGAGTLMSTAQKGRSDLKLASLRRDRALVDDARTAAIELVGDDPQLSEHPDLRAELDLMFSDREESFLTKS